MYIMMYIIVCLWCELSVSIWCDSMLC